MSLCLLEVTHMMERSELMVASAETVVLRSGDRARRERFVDALTRTGHAGTVSGDPVPGSGWLVMLGRSVTDPVPVGLFVEHGAAVLREFEAANHGRLVEGERFVVAFVAGGGVVLGVGVRYADRVLAGVEAGVTGQHMLFNLVTGQQEYV